MLLFPLQRVHCRINRWIALIHRLIFNAVHCFLSELLFYELYSMLFLCYYIYVIRMLYNIALRSISNQRANASIFLFSVR
jgi:hypothetical protein